MFNHIDLDLKPIARETIDGVRYYKIPDEEEPKDEEINSAMLPDGNWVSYKKSDINLADFEKDVTMTEITLNARAVREVAQEPKTKPMEVDSAPEATQPPRPPTPDSPVITDLDNTSSSSGEEPGKEWDPLGEEEKVKKKIKRRSNQKDRRFSTIIICISFSFFFSLTASIYLQRD